MKEIITLLESINNHLAAIRKNTEPKTFSVTVGGSVIDPEQFARQIVPLVKAAMLDGVH